MEDIKFEGCDTLLRGKHIECLKKGLISDLPPVFERLVPSQTWTVYWISHSLSLLEQQQFLDTKKEDVINFLRQCAHADGGYGGGPGQIAHLATTYAAINALITLCNNQALESIDRTGIVKFLHRMKQPDGSFRMHDDGEVDSRSVYCALSILRCLNIEDSVLLENVANWILSCQTYEGGFGSLPGSEAHGGYNFCCIASLCLLNQTHRADLESQLRWLVSKQMSNDGGFCGRTNKLVDSCYSFWQGAVFALIQPQMSKDETNESQRKTRSQTTQSCIIHSKWLFDCSALQDYILNKCQSDKGLIRDKPGVNADFYHTCYALSGMTVSQHNPDGSKFDLGFKASNELSQTHPLFNLNITALNECHKYFNNKKIEIMKL